MRRSGANDTDRRQSDRHGLFRIRRRSLWPPGLPNLKGESGPGAMVDDRVALALHKPPDFVLFRNGERLSPAATIAGLRAAPPGFIFPAAAGASPTLLPSRCNEWHRWIDTPLADREIPCLVFDLEGWMAEVTHFHTENIFQYARLTALGGRVWLGVSSPRPDDRPERLPLSCLEQLTTIFPPLKPGERPHYPAARPAAEPPNGI